MVDLRVKPGASQPHRSTADGVEYHPVRSTRDGSICTIPWAQIQALEGRAFLMQVGTEDAPVDSTVTIDDEKVWALIDVAAGTTVIPISAQVEVAVWSDAATLNVMLEVDNAKARYSAGGTAFTPLNLRTDAPIASTSTCYVGTDVTASAKTSGGSLELWRASIEVNLGNAADDVRNFIWEPETPPVLVGPASLLLHFGCGSTTDPTGYGNIQWIEVPSSSIT